MLGDVLVRLFNLFGYLSGEDEGQVRVHHPLERLVQKKADGLMKRLVQKKSRRFDEETRPKKKQTV
jgi:hypothetical protein